MSETSKIEKWNFKHMTKTLNSFLIFSLKDFPTILWFGKELKKEDKWMQPQKSSEFELQKALVRT